MGGGVSWRVAKTDGDGGGERGVSGVAKARKAQFLSKKLVESWVVFAGFLAKHGRNLGVN